MRLTKKTDYCIRILIFLQSHKDTGKRLFRIQEIADAYDISKNHLSVAVNQLSELGYILTTQGAKGGIEFNIKAKEESLETLVSQLEKFEIVECFEPEANTCTLKPNCKLRKILQKSTKAFLNELKNYTIQDLV